MAFHSVNFTVPERPLGNADIEFSVRRDRAKFGKLRISKGAVVWIPANKRYGYKLGWRRLAALLESEGRKGHK